MTVWPRVVEFLLASLPGLDGWDVVSVYDTDAITEDAPANYAIIGKTSDDNTSGNFVRLVDPSTMVEESGTVRVHIVTRTGENDPPGMRDLGFALFDALEAFLHADHTLAGVLGQVGTVDITTDVLSVASPLGVAQSLIVSVNYTSLT